MGSIDAIQNAVVLTRSMAVDVFSLIEIKD